MTKPKRVAFFLPSLAGGGAERVCLQLFEPLRRLGYSPFLILSQKTGELVAELPSDTELFVLDCARTREAFLPLLRTLKIAQADVLVSSLEHNNMIALIARAISALKVPVIVRQDNILLQLGTAMARVYSALLPFADAVVSVSRGVEEDLAKHAFGKPRRSTVIYNPVIRKNLAELAAEGSPAAVSPGAPPTFVGCGRLVPQKDFALLIRAFAECRKTMDARLVILGDGPLRAQLGALSDTLGVARDVTFAGFQPNPFPYMARATAVVLSSAFEGFGNVVAEALALGTPVISTDCPHGPAEILDNGRYGQLVPVGDVDAMADAMRKVARAPARAIAPPSWLSQFTPEFAARRYSAVIEDVIAKDGAPRPVVASRS